MALGFAAPFMANHSSYCRSIEDLGASVAASSALGVPAPLCGLPTSLRDSTDAYEEYSAVRYESPRCESPVSRPFSAAFGHVNLPQSPIRDVWASHGRELGREPLELDPSPASRGAPESVQDKPPSLPGSASSPDLTAGLGLGQPGLGRASRFGSAVVRSSSARELGTTRPYSPPVVLVGDLQPEACSQRETFGGSRQFRQEQDVGDIEVIFDPGIGCYYDPKTNKYYTCAD